MTIDTRDANQVMRELSGAIADGSPLVRFLYTLIRDHVPPGQIEEVLNASRFDQPDGPPIVIYTNGWLAQYAQNVAARIEANGYGDLADNGFRNIDVAGEEAS